MLQKQALDILKTGVNVFLTGAPGSGKSYLINEYIQFLKSHNIDFAVTASTGIAATHIGGNTVHSFFGLGISDVWNEKVIDNILSKEYIVKKVKKIEVLIIDEISMLTLETLNKVNFLCKKIKQNPEPFGNIQIVVVGDFFQLPPINKNKIQYNQNSQDNQDIENNIAHISPDKNFVFKASAWQEARFTTCYLSSQFRSQDPDLENMLLAIREKSLEERHFKILKKLKEKTENHFFEDFSQITNLFTHNLDVDSINMQELQKISQPSFFYNMSFFGNKNLCEILKKNCLASENLELKVGAKIMCIKNIGEQNLTNGDLGIVTSLSQNRITIKLEKNGQILDILESSWEIVEEGKLKARITQYPLRLAWAITVHKSQGMSLSSAYMDLSKVFEYGQGYVALSRVRDLEGLFLKDYNEIALQIDEQVFHFDKLFKKHSENVLNKFQTLNSDKIQQMHKDFLIKSKGSLEAITIKNTSQNVYINVSKNVSKKDTLTETLELVKAGKKISEIASLRNLNIKTILDHLEKLKDSGDISVKDLNKTFSKDKYKIPKEVTVAFKKHGSQKLKPVFDELNDKIKDEKDEIKEEYSFDDLKIWRLLL